ncbi:MAG: hypothetical protein HY255_07105 [Betaproteobacteria bacterium]|nr:hypothetical protein [Betaproteobacteria bacterium]
MGFDTGDRRAIHGFSHRRPHRRAAAMLALGQAKKAALAYNHCMMLPRLARKLAAATAILGLLFSQIAVSAYACPVMFGGAAQASSGESAEPPCHHQAGDTNRGLCQAHCQHGQQSSGDASALATVADFVAAYAVIVPAATQDMQSATPIGIDLFHSTSPPLAIRNCCFRI